MMFGPLHDLIDREAGQMQANSLGRELGNAVSRRTVYSLVCAASCPNPGPIRLLI